MSQQTLSRIAKRVAIALASKSSIYIKMPSNLREETETPAILCPTRFREQRVKFPKKRRILRPGEVIGLAGFLPNCCSMGFSIRVNSHVNFICAMKDIYDVIR
ncbi:hypothetical protein SFRURICE_015391 [Spodoptera frugiperda]|nr:hypothetical protein SFRURICE_015391 [Spodoptera frugiperda]